MSAVATKPITADEFLRLSDPPNGRNDELIQGEVVVMPLPGFRHGRCQVRIVNLLDAYGAVDNRGRAVGEVGLLLERNPDTVRGPDVAYLSAERLPLSQEPAGFLTVAPELCVEILSPTNRRTALRKKIREYFDFGVRMAWVVDPEDRTLTVYRSADEARLFHETATFADDEVLPGFRCAVAELFA